MLKIYVLYSAYVSSLGFVLDIFRACKKCFGNLTSFMFFCFAWNILNIIFLCFFEKAQPRLRLIFVVHPASSRLCVFKKHEKILYKRLYAKQKKNRKHKTD